MKMYNFTSVIFRNGILVKHNYSPKYNLKILFDMHSLNNSRPKSVYKDYIEEEECLKRLNKKTKKIEKN
jgi:hypothetical protein